MASLDWYWPFAVEHNVQLHLLGQNVYLPINWDQNSSNATDVADANPMQNHRSVAE